jgi:hypothetical protein
MAFPMYHVFADLAEGKDGTVVASASTDPLAVETLALLRDGTLLLSVANLTPEPRMVEIDCFANGPVAARRLNEAVAARAAFDPDRFRAVEDALVADDGLALTLAPFEVVRLRGPLATARK